MWINEPFIQFEMKYCAVHSHCNEININFISYLHLALVYILTGKIWCNNWHYVSTIIYTRICLFATRMFTHAAFKMAKTQRLCPYANTWHRGSPPWWWCDLVLSMYQINTNKTDCRCFWLNTTWELVIGCAHFFYMCPRLHHSQYLPNTGTITHI